MTTIPIVKFVIHEDRDVWWAESYDLGHPYYATAESKTAVMDMCREGVRFALGRSHTEVTLVFVDESEGLPQ